MKIDFNWLVIICGAMIVLGLFAAFPLWMSKENRRSNRILSILLLSISLWLVDFFFNISGIYGQDPDYYFKPIYYSFAFGPLIYLYVKSITQSDFSLRFKHLLHFIPVVIQAALYCFLCFKDYSFRNWYWQEVHLPYTYRVEFNGTFLSSEFCQRSKYVRAMWEHVMVIGNSSNKGSPFSGVGWFCHSQNSFNLSLPRFQTFRCQPITKIVSLFYTPFTLKRVNSKVVVLQTLQHAV